MVHGFLELPVASIVGCAGGKSPVAVLELDCNSYQDKDFEIPISNLNYSLDNAVNLSTALTYTESNLVPVPIIVVPTVTESGMEVIVSKGVA
ncbi:hypothetical protein V6N13_004701 [Hibiscus sabdariffa]|uniref:Uncharacterized protein n=1 Tax=Hibiscus sabdariffa TaxID=183260 RepID=A0ABR2S010_9ROSI